MKLELTNEQTELVLMLVERHCRQSVSTLTILQKQIKEQMEITNEKNNSIDKPVDGK
jgi:hypothetical protein